MDDLMNYLFSEAGRDHVKGATPFFELLSVAAGTELIHEDAEDDTTMFIIVDGDLEVVRNGARLATLHSGTLAGELGLFGYGYRTASVIAETHAQLIAIDRMSFLRLQESGNLVAWVLEIRALATTVRRLRDTRLRITQLRGTVDRRSGPTLGERVRSGLTFWRWRVGGAQRRARLLASLPGFSEADETVLLELAHAMHGRRFSQGEHICVSGSDAYKVFLVAQGRADLLDAQGQPVGQVEPGFFFGVAAMLEDRPYHSTYVAGTDDTVVLMLDHRRWDVFADQATRPASVLRCAMVVALAHQLDYANQVLLEALESQSRDLGEWTSDTPTPPVADSLFKG